MKSTALAVVLCASLLLCASCDPDESPGAAGAVQAVPTRIAPMTPEVVPAVPGVSCALSVENNEGRITAALVFRNDQSETVDIPHWMLIPDGNLSASLFYILHDGMELVYTCRMVYWGAPSQQQVITLAPGETFSTRTILSRCYDFNSPGDYRVKYQTGVRLPGSKAPIGTAPDVVIGIASNVVNVSVP